MPQIVGKRRDMLSETGENKDWFLLSNRIKRDRALKLREYAAEYLEPILSKFPELKGKVYLALRKRGWFAEHKPVLHIIVRAEDLEKSSSWRIRSITAHELMHLVQYLHGIGTDERWNKTIERQATFRSFARGFAYDFLKAFPAECTREPCDHKFAFGYFRCDSIFQECCRDLPETLFQKLAQMLEVLARRHDSWEQYDFVELVSNCLVGDSWNEDDPIPYQGGYEA